MNTKDFICHGVPLGEATPAGDGFWRNGSFE
jgi:hypothetical protein